jgi:hypothetical protein
MTITRLSGREVKMMRMSARRQKIMMLYETGVPQVKIAKIMGCAPSFVSDTLTVAASVYPMRYGVADQEFWAALREYL